MSTLEDQRFAASPSGPFRERYGPNGPDVPHSSKKLCLVAADAQFLIDLLYGLSLREDCFYVKYGTVARDGMYLGRCFLATDEAASELCQELKGHPRLLVSLQDDAWFASFRRARVPGQPFHVRDELPAHAAQVAAVVEAAFERPDEAGIVAALREARAAVVSLVAQVNAEAGSIIGHVMLSPVTLGGSSEPRGLGLGPLAVAPEFQRTGVGSRLVEAALRRARLLGYSYVVVLGHPPYYPRFGFLPASRFGLSYPAPVPDPVFMAIELVPGALAGSTGVVRYHRALSG
jgi:putative acetyltransferase